MNASSQIEFERDQWRAAYRDLFYELCHKMRLERPVPIGDANESAFLAAEREVERKAELIALLWRSEDEARKRIAATPTESKR